MTPQQLKNIRVNTLRLSAEKLAQRIGVASGRTIRRWEAGDNPIPAWARIAIERLARETTDERAAVAGR